MLLGYLKMEKSKEKNKAFIEFLSRLKKLYDELPDWKKGVLEASSKAFNSKPREPINKNDQIK
jgi:hypothetical protein